MKEKMLVFENWFEIYLQKYLFPDQNPFWIKTNQKQRRKKCQRTMVFLFRILLEIFFLFLFVIFINQNGFWSGNKYHEQM